MPRFLKFAALTAGVLLLLMLAAVLTLRARVNPNDYKADIIRLVQERHHRTLQIPGNISLTMYPRLGADLGRVSLSEHASPDTFATVAHARISVALLPLLLRQEVEIYRVDLRGVDAKVVRFADGSMTTGDLTSAHMAHGAQTSGGKGRSAVRVAIQSIRVDSARVVFDDRKSARQYHISNLNIDSGPIARGTPSRMALSANVRLNRPAVSTAVTLKTRFMPSLEQRRISFTDVEANLDLSFKDAKVTLAGKVDVDLDKDEFAADLKGRFDDSAFDLQGGFRDNTHQLTVHVDKVDLGRYQNRLVPDAIPDDPTILEAGDAFDLSPLAMLVANGGVHVGELKVGTMHATNVRAALRSGGGKFVLQPIGANLYGGTGTGAVTLDFARSASTPHLTFIGSMKAIEIGPLLGDLLDKTPVEGRGDVTIDVNTQGASTLQMRQALSGTASFALAEGTVHGIDVAKMVLGAQAASGLAGVDARTSFSRLAASFTIADGVAHNADLSLQAGPVAITGAGDIDLGKELIDYTLACTVPDSGIALPVRLSGPWSQIGWRVETKTISGAAVRQKASEKLNKAIRGILKR